MADAFISYSRSDTATVRRLHEGLAARGREVWVDWEDIRPTEAFMEAIDRAIEAANVFVFIISPDSVASTVCRHELEHANTHGKKLVPIVCRDTPSASVPPPLASLNWIFSRDADDPGHAVELLIAALDTDLDWVREHTRLLVRATEWDKRGRNKSYLLHGVDLAQAERALANVAAARSPQPTLLQREYVLMSRQGASRRQRILLTGVAVALVVALGLAWLAETRRQQAEDARQRGLARQLAAQSELVRRPSGEPLTLSALLASESLKHYWSVEGDLALRRALALLPRPVIKRADIGAANAQVFSSDGLLLAVAPAGGNVDVSETLTGRSLAQLAQPAAVSIDWSPDSGYLLTVDGERVARVWQLADRTLAASFQLDSDLVAAAFAAESPRLAVAVEADEDHPLAPVTLWDLVGGGMEAKLVPSVPTRALALDAGGETVITLGSTFTSTALEVWQAPFTKPLAQQRSDGLVNFAAFNRAGTTLVFTNPLRHIGGGTSGQQDMKLIEVSPPLGDEGWSFDEVVLKHPCTVRSALLSADDRQVVTSCDDNVIRAWSTADGQPGARVSLSSEPRVMALAADPGTLAIAGEDGFVHLFELSAGRHVTSVAQADVETLSITADGRRLITLDVNGHVTVRATNAGSEARHWVVPADVREVYLDKSGKIAACTEDGAFLLDRAADAGVTKLPAHNALHCAFAPGGRAFFTVSAAGMCGGDCDAAVIGDDNARAWDTASGRELWSRTRNKLSDAALSPDGRLVAIGDRAGVITISRLADGRVVRRLSISRGFVTDGTQGNTSADSVPPWLFTSLEFSPGGERLVAAYRSRHAQAWDLTSGTAGRAIAFERDTYVSTVAPGAQLFTTSTTDGWQRLWESDSGREIKLAAGDEGLQDITFSPDGHRVGALLQDHRTVRVWDFPSRREVASFTHLAGVHVIRFSPDGAYVATSSGDGDVHVWEIAARREVARMGHASAVFGLGFSADGKDLAVRVDHDIWLEHWRREDLLSATAERLARNLTPDEWRQYIPEESYRATFPALPSPEGESRSPQ